MIADDMKMALVSIGLFILAAIFAAGIVALVIMGRAFVRTWREEKASCNDQPLTSGAFSET